MQTQKKIPRSFKWIFGLFILVWFPSYFLNYGLSQFLWFSDILLIEAFLATCFESSFIASMAASGGLLITTGWVADFFVSTSLYFLGSNSLGGTAYMFDSPYPLWLRLLSLFHLGLPLVLYGLIVRLGYDRRAWPLQILLFFFAIVLAHHFSTPKENINLVYDYTIWNPMRWKPQTYLIVGSCILALSVFGTHLVLQKLVDKK